MAYLSVNCPQCGVKSNLQESSIDTMRRCPNCGHKFIVKAAPFSLGGCLAGILALFGIGAVAIVGCCGLVGLIGSSSSDTQPPSDPVTAPESGQAVGGMSGFNDFYVEIKQLDEIVVCNVTFRKLPPTADIAENVVRSAMQDAIKKHPNQEILGMAFDLDGDTLPDEQYGGPVTYKPSDKRILTMREREGLKTTEQDQGEYLVQIEERKTATGIIPVRRWLTVSIVFPTSPSESDAKVAAVREIEKLKARGLDVTVYIHTGEKSNKITWRQTPAPNGKFMLVEYEKATGTITPNWNWGASAIESKSADGAQARGKPQAQAETAALKRQLCVYLEQLLKFKDEPQFREYGFGTGGPYNKWLKDVEALRDAQPTGNHPIPLVLRAAPGDLITLGMEYIHGESNYTRRMLPEIKETIDFDAYLAEQPAPARLTSEPSAPARVTSERAFHKWTSGEYSTEAQFLSMTAGMVKLRKRDGAVIEIPLDKLSEADQEYIRSGAYKRGE